MPFVEIGNVPKNWIKISPSNHKLGISVYLRNILEIENKQPLRVRLFYDRTNSLFGIKADSNGYKVVEGRIMCRKLPPEVDGKFEASWDEKQKMIIADLKRKF